MDTPPIPADAAPLFGPLFIEPLKRAVALTRLVAANPQRRRLSAEFAYSTTSATMETVRALQWKEPTQFLNLSTELRDANERIIHLPEVAKAVIRNTARLQEAIELLAELGFLDAIDEDALLSLASRYQNGVDGMRVGYVLERVEWIARERLHVGHELAKIRLSGTYARAIFQACCSQISASIEQSSDANRQGLVQSLLGRLERVDTIATSDCLGLSLSFLGFEAIGKPTASWKSISSTNYDLDTSGSAATMWGYVHAWARSSPLRLAAYARALSMALLRLDTLELTDERKKLDVGTLWHAIDLLARDSSSTESETPFFQVGPVVALAILSANWESSASSLRNWDHDLIAKFDDLNGQRRVVSQRVSAEAMLQRGAELLGHHAGLKGGLTQIVFPFRLLPDAGDPPDVTFPITAPAEAILLRAQSSDIMTGVSRFLMELQGPHDGIAYAHLAELSLHPKSRAARRSLAHHCVQSPWRQILSDPTILARLGRESWYFGGGDSDPYGRLCQLLSEPLQGIPDGGSIVDALQERCSTGEWKDRADQTALLHLVLRLPGACALQAASVLLESEDIDRIVVDAFEQLSQHNNQPVGRLARNVLVLREAASRAPVYSAQGRTVELELELPGLLTRLLDELDSTTAPIHDTRDGLPRIPDGLLGSESVVMPSSGDALPRPPESLAAAEAGLLRICLQVVEEVAIVQSARTRLWLGWRLYGWFAQELDEIRSQGRDETVRTALLQLSRIAPAAHRTCRDPLDPFGFASARYNHRLAAVIHAIAVGEYWASEHIPLRSTATLEQRLVTFADRHAEPGPTSDLLDWRAPANIPDLAVWALLALNSRAFTRLTPEARKRAIERIPDELAETHRLLPVAATVLTGAAVAVNDLNSEERQALERKVRSFAPGAITQRLAWSVLTALYAAGEQHLQQEVYALLLDNAGANDVSASVSLLLSVELPEDLPSRTRQLLSLARERRLPLAAFFAGLGRIALNGTEAHRATARALLSQLANEFQGESELNDLLVALEIDGSGN